MTETIQNKIENWRNRQTQQHQQDQAGYRDFISRFDTLSALEETELETLAKTLGIPPDKIGQHVLAWREIKANEKIIAEIPGLEAEQKAFYAELNKHMTETEIIIKERNAKGTELSDRMENRKSEVAKRWAIENETRELRWANKELFFDDTAIMERTNNADRHRRHQDAMNKSALG